MEVPSGFRIIFGVPILERLRYTVTCISGFAKRERSERFSIAAMSWTFKPKKYSRNANFKQRQALTMFRLEHLVET